MNLKNKMPNKIKINNNLWFTILGNKLVFGNSALGKELHYTFSFGNKSGILDLHMTNKNGKHYTVLKISHQNIYEILPDLIAKINKSIFNFSEFNWDKIEAENLELFKIKQLDDISNELGNLIHKNRIIIDNDSEGFKKFIQNITINQTVKSISMTDLKSHTQFLGLVKSKKDFYFLIKDSLFGDQLYIINSIDLDINSVLGKIIGKDVYESILQRINNGILYLRE